MDAKKLSQNIAMIEKSIENEELADGLDILAATLSHALILSIQSGNFNRAGEYNILSKDIRFSAFCHFQSVLSLFACLGHSSNSLYQITFPLLLVSPIHMLSM